MSSIRALLALALVAYCTQSALGCSCELPNFRQQFCRSKYAAVVTVRGHARQLDDGFYAAHSVDIRHVLRSTGDDAEAALRSEVVYTRRRRSSCAGELVPKATYVIFGEPSTDGRAVVTACTAINFELLTDEERAEIESYAKGGVPCR